MTHAVAVGHWPLSHLLQLGVVVCLPGEDRWLPEPLALGGVSCPLWTVVGHLLHPHPRGRQGGREEGGGREGGGEGGSEGWREGEMQEVREYHAIVHINDLTPAQMKPTPSLLPHHPHYHFSYCLTPSLLTHLLTPPTPSLLPHLHTPHLV